MCVPESDVNHTAGGGEEEDFLFPSRNRSAPKTISASVVAFELRHASESSYLMSDTIEGKSEGLYKHLETHQRCCGRLRSVQEIFSCLHG